MNVGINAMFVCIYVLVIISTSIHISKEKENRGDNCVGLDPEIATSAEHA